jgi:hypothetical protein
MRSNIDSFTDGYTDDLVPVGISPRVEKNLQSMPQSPTSTPTAWYLLVIHQELKNIYGPCHNHRRVYRRLAQSPTAIPTD